jgi:hypothetical protein
MAMINGLDRFTTFFEGYEDRFVLIGGVAAMQWLDAAGLHPRATKDFDIVLMVDTLDAPFFNRFWEFVRSGGYSNLQKSTGNRVYYRFTDPVEKDYPFMLEIFSRVPEGVMLWGDPAIVPIPAGDDASSLSAILMDEAYYAMVRENRVMAAGLPLLSPECLILLKARAWLDLTARRREGHHVDERDIKKHRTDIFKLALLLTQDRRLHIPQTVRRDLLDFLGHFPPDAADWAGIRQSSGVAERMPRPAGLLRIIELHFPALEEKRP